MRARVALILPRNHRCGGDQKDQNNTHAKNPDYHRGLHPSTFVSIPAFLKSPSRTSELGEHLLGLLPCC